MRRRGRRDIQGPYYCERRGGKTLETRTLSETIEREFMITRTTLFKLDFVGETDVTSTTGQS